MDCDFEELPSNTPLGLSMAAGAIAGIMEHTVMFPVDAIKTRMQVAGASKVYKGVVSSITRVNATEGFAALWRGVASVVLGAGPAHALHYTIYETISNYGQDKAGPTAAMSALAGVAATTTSDALMTPFDVIKQRMQLPNSSKSMLQTAARIWAKEGFTAFYISYPITLLMNVPFTAINFAVYDQVSHLMNAQRRHDPLVHCVSGGLAGATAAAFSTPFDVIKTLLQTRGVSPDRRARELNSVAGAAKYIYQTDGLRGFLRGVKPRILVNMPSTAISWTVYEMAKFYIVAAYPELTMSATLE